MAEENKIKSENAKHLNNQLNKSGFPLQIMLAAEVNTAASNQDITWREKFSEFYWTNSVSDGFIDLILEGVSDRGSHKFRIIVEVKRYEDSELIFIRDGFSSIVEEINEQRPFQSKFLLSFFRQQVDGSKPCKSSWTSMLQSPRMEPHSFCVTNAKNRERTLEPLCNQLIEATEAFSKYECEYLSQNLEYGAFVYCCVLVTTSKLYSCDLNSCSIDLSNGSIKEGTEFKKVNWIKFQKSLRSEYRKIPPPAGNLIENNEDVILANERTVFICNSEHFIEFLKKLSINV